VPSLTIGARVNWQWQPRAQDIWDTFAGRTSDESSSADALSPWRPIELLLRRLHESNAAQWRAEDVARGAPTDQQLAATKRAIDAHNGRRVALIERIDQAFAERLPGACDAPPLTSQPGSTCDQLSVLELRLRTVEGGAGDFQAIRDVRAKALAVRDAFDADLRDVRDGRRRVLVLPMHKRYTEQFAAST
jgi:hypothetical protein